MVGITHVRNYIMAANDIYRDYLVTYHIKSLGADCDCIILDRHADILGRLNPGAGKPVRGKDAVIVRKNGKRLSPVKGNRICTAGRD